MIATTYLVSTEHAPELRRLFLQAQQAWPGVALLESDFLQHLIARLPDADSLTAALAQVAPADLYLACAAERRTPAAMIAFESTFLRRVGHYVGRVDGSPEFVAEVTQTLRVKLFVGENGRSGKIGQYSGRGTLESWLCAVALRTAHDLLREQSHHPPGEHGGWEVLAGSDDVELEVLRARHQDEFQEALRTALGEVVGRDRTLLRLYFLEELTTARIGRIYGVHETTVLRWIVRIREGVAERVHALVRKKLVLSSSDFGNLMALLRSRIDVSMRLLIQTNPDP